MMKKLLLAGLIAGSSSFVLAQTTINVRVNSALDDHEERCAGNVTQSGTLGDMIVGSDDLELGNENPTSNPQLVGLRFTNVTIPKGATIMSAYIQFAVDSATKNTDPCNLNIYAQDNANPVTFSDAALSLSGRSLAAGFITWNVSGASWGTVGSAGADQRTPELKSLLTPLIFKTGWASGNAMAFFIKGSGTREVESYEGDPTKAPELVVTYSILATGIENSDRSISVNVYPNPFKGSFSVNVDLPSASDLSISVFDLTGKLVEDKVLKQVAAGTFHYTSTSDLRPGMYFVKVKTNTGQQVVKLISE